MQLGQQEGEMVKHLIIITRYFVPHKVVDSDSVYQMIVKLLQLNPTLVIHVVTTDNSYKSEVVDETMYAKSILDKVTIHRIKTFKLWPKSKVTQLMENVIESFRLVLKAKALKIVNVISLTNPPLISMWCSVFLKNRNFFYWTFDLYPEAFVADGLLKSDNIVYKFFEHLTYKNSPKALISLGSYQYLYLNSKFGEESTRIILPCGIHDNLQKSDLNRPTWADPNKITMGYIGNLGRAHSLAFLKNVLKEVSGKSNMDVVVSVYGFHKQAVLKYVSELNASNIYLLDYVDKSDLTFIDIHLVSLKESWKNVSVPSKAVSAVCGGSIIWFCGPEDCDTWGLLNSCSFRSLEHSNDVSATLKRVNWQLISKLKSNASLLKNDLLKMEHGAYESINQNLK
jgi:hypothetical protein